MFNRSSRWSQPYRASSRDGKALNQGTGVIVADDCEQRARERSKVLTGRGGHVVAVYVLEHGEGGAYLRRFQVAEAARTRPRRSDVQDRRRARQGKQRRSEAEAKDEGSCRDWRASVSSGR